MGSRDIHTAEADLLRAIRESIGNFINTADDVITLVIISFSDGTTIFSSSNSGNVVNEFLSSSSSAISEIGLSFLEYSGMGSLGEVILRGERGYVIIRKLDEDVVLALGTLSRDLDKSLRLVDELERILLRVAEENKEKLILE